MKGAVGMVLGNYQRQVMENCAERQVVKRGHDSRWRRVPDIARYDEKTQTSPLDDAPVAGVSPFFPVVIREFPHTFTQSWNI